MLHPRHDDPHAVNYLIDDGRSDPVVGTVRADLPSIVWNGGMLATALIAGPMTFGPSAFLLFVTSTGLALLFGHSLGYHRLMIHGSFAGQRWFERFLIWCGAWVGMASPRGIIKAHDMRDWAQRQPACHPYFSHRSHPLRDAWWQIYCRIELDREPRFDFSTLDADPFVRWLEWTWRWQQLPVAILFYAVGGWSWVVWGVAARVAIATHGHWLVGYLAHTRGPQSWLVDGAGVQAHDVPWAAIPTMGEAWHNSHHAYPGSARIGLYPGQSDWGFLILRAAKRLGLVWNVQTPETLTERSSLRAATLSLFSEPPARFEPDAVRSVAS